MRGVQPSFTRDELIKFIVPSGRAADPSDLDPPYASLDFIVQDILPCSVFSYCAGLDIIQASMSVTLTESLRPPGRYAFNSPL